MLVKEKIDLREYTTLEIVWEGSGNPEEQHTIAGIVLTGARIETRVGRTSEEEPSDA